MIVTTFNIIKKNTIIVLIRSNKILLKPLHCFLLRYEYCYIIKHAKHIVHPPPPPPSFLLGRERGGLNLPKFQKGAWQDLNFWLGLVGKRGVTFLRGDCNFYIENKLKSEIFNDKKFWKTKMFFCVITKNSSWDILSKNLVTFKR